MRCGLTTVYFPLNKHTTASPKTPKVSLRGINKHEQKNLELRTKGTKWQTDVKVQISGPATESPAAKSSTNKIWHVKDNQSTKWSNDRPEESVSTLSLIPNHFKFVFFTQHKNNSFSYFFQRIFPKNFKGTDFNDQSLVLPWLNKLSR